MTCGQTCLMLLGFPCGGVFKRYTEGKKYPGPTLCQTAERFCNHRPREALDKLTNTSVFAFRIHLWRVSSKYPANMKSGPLKPLNKHGVKPATNMQTIWNETSLCVFFIQIYSGMFLCLWITNNKLRNICSESQSERLWGCFFFSFFS